MRKVLALTAAIVAFGAAPAAAQAPMTFFVTSSAGPDASGPTGIKAADEYCQLLGYGAGYSDFDWRAFLDAPAVDGQEAVPAAKRVGDGPWHNQEGALIAESAEQLAGAGHLLGPQTALDERGFKPYTRAGAPDPAEVLASGKPDATGRYFCFAR
jgi:hypothetical protein